MQVRKYDTYANRSLYYLSRMYSRRLKFGKDYGILKPVIGIHFLNYKMFPDHPDFHYHFDLRDRRYQELLLTDALSLNIFELPTIEKIRKEKRPGGDRAEWLHFLNHAHEEGEETMRAQYKNQAIHKAFGIFRDMSADEETRRLAEMREDALRNEVSMLAAAERKGETVKAIKVAENLLALNILTAEQISDSTGLGLDEVRELKKSAQTEDFL